MRLFYSKAMELQLLGYENAGYLSDPQKAQSQTRYIFTYGNTAICKTRENSNFLKKGKMVISIKIQNFSRSQMMKRTSPLGSSREI